MSLFESRKVWTIAFFLNIFLIRFGLGMYQSMTGTTLLFLAENTHSSVASASFIFSGRAAGQLIGACLCSLLMNSIKGFRPLLTIAIVVVVAGALMIATPWITDLIGLIFSVSVGGFASGYLDSGVVALFFKTWGEKGTRSIMQAYHFAVSLGSAIAPVIASPFLEMVESEQGTTDDSSCPGSNVNSTLDPSLYGTSSAYSPVIWPYVITGCIMVPCGAVLVILSLLNVEEKIASEEKFEQKKRLFLKEEPLKDVYLLFLAVIFYYAAVAGIQRIYDSYIYSIALCSGLSFSIANAAWLNTLYFTGLVIGRGCGIFITKYFSPKTMIIYDLTGITVALVIFSIVGEEVSLIIWLVSLFFGLCQATLYSAGISFVSQITNVSSSYVFIFTLGNGLGSMAVPPVAGLIFEQNPFDLSYMLVGMCGWNIIGFSLVYVIGRNHQTPFDILEYSTRL